MTVDGTMISGSDSVRAFFPGDVDGSMNVNLVDAMRLLYAYGSMLGDRGWNLAADFNLDGVVDSKDAAELALYYGTSV